MHSYSSHALSLRRLGACEMGRKVRTFRVSSSAVEPDLCVEAAQTCQFQVSSQCYVRNLGNNALFSSFQMVTKPDFIPSCFAGWIGPGRQRRSRHETTREHVVFVLPRDDQPTSQICGKRLQQGFIETTQPGCRSVLKEA